MGGEDKEKKITKPSVRQEKSGGVFDVAISKLLQDFTSAELFPQSLDNMPHGASSCPESNCDSVVLSMKHLHLHRPTSARQRRLRRCVQRKRQSSNSLNLAVAASSFQRPLVWPARLTTHSRKLNSNVLYPSRLCINGSPGKGASTNVATSKTETAVKNCSEEEKARIETTLQRQEFVPFGNVSSANYSSLSFSGLCEQSRQNQDENSEQDPSSHGAASNQSTTCSSATLSKRHSTGCVPPAKFARTVADNDETVSQRTVFSDYRNPASSRVERESACGCVHYSSGMASDLSRSSLGQRHCQCPSASVAASPPSESDTASSLETLAALRSALVSSAQSTTQGTSESGSLSHSCSQELRMEETNVNELASYFDDMLHIPRKMSTMAEMMYA